MIRNSIILLIQIVMAITIPSLILNMPSMLDLLLETKLQPQYIYDQFKMFLFFSFLFSTGYVLFLGLPIVKILHAKKKYTLKNILIFGALAGFLPWVYFLLPSDNSSYSAWHNGGMVDFVVDGSFTLQGWIGYFKTLLQMGFLGACSAFSYWIVGFSFKQQSLPDQKIIPSS